MHGRGVLVMADGKRWVVDRERSVLIFVLVGTLLSEWRGARSRYEGEWQHDEKHGQGAFTFPSGDRCVDPDCVPENGVLSAFSPSQRRARNVHTHRGVRTCRYEGEWYANCMHGQGTFSDSMGWCYTGSFEDDRPTRGVLRAADGQIYSVTYATNLIKTVGLFGTDQRP